jgi:hypothetical protein
LLVLFLACQPGPAAAAVNLFRNPSFEMIPGPAAGQGVLPSEWLQTGDIVPGADTYSVDGSYGLSPGEFDHWPGQTAQDGIRWVAGGDFSGGNNEAIGQGQSLADMLVVGQLYQLSGYVKNDTRASSGGNAGFRVLLAESPSILAPNVEVGSLQPATSSTQWQPRGFSFIAPNEAAAWNTIIFKPFAETPGGFVYPALDSVSLMLVPEPGALVTLATCLLPLLLAGRRLRRLSIS